MKYSNDILQVEKCTNVKNDKNFVPKVNQASKQLKKVLIIYMIKSIICYLYSFKQANNFYL